MGLREPCQFGGHLGKTENKLSLCSYSALFCCWWCCDGVAVSLCFYMSCFYIDVKHLADPFGCIGKNKINVKGWYTFFKKWERKGEEKRERENTARNRGGNSRPDASKSLNGQLTSFASFCPCSIQIGFSFMSFSLAKVLGSSRRSIC